MVSFFLRVHDRSVGYFSSKGLETMKPLGILKGACTIVGATALSATVLMVALHAFTSLELPRLER